MKYISKLAVTAPLTATAPSGSAQAQDERFRFVVVSHIGSNNASMGW